MKIAVVIFSLNANQKNMWESVLHSYAMQGVKYSSYILVDCESTDSTVTFAQKYGWEIVLQDRKSFNHGKTRQKIADRLYAENYDIAILATQDVTLMTADTLETLVNNLKQTGAAVAYARQVPVCEQSFDGYFRLRNYPSASLVKDSTSIDQLGLMTPFVSNSLAAWDLKKISIYGGFPETDFGEDMLLGAKFILNGEKISYCAESCCRHEHDSSWREIFMRGVAIGGLHVRNPLLTEKFGRLESCAKISIKISDAMHYFCPLAIKYLGYMVGKWREKIKKQEIFLPLLMVVSFVCGLALCTLNIIPANDTCTRYAPMAQAFAEGNFKFAFHPMYGTLFQALSGSICYLFSLNGFRACQLAALLLWWISIIPIYKIFKCVFDKKVAQWSCILYVLCSHLHRYVYDGLRDNGRTLGIALLCLGMIKIWQEQKQKYSTFKNYATLSSGCVVLTALRADGFMLAIIGLCFAVFIDITTNKLKCWRSIAAGLVFLLCILPQVYLTWKYTGIPSVSTRHSDIIQKIITRLL